jgi:hypothetical protein
MKTKKQAVKQKIIATTVVLFMLFMMFGSLKLPGALATTTTTNLIQNMVSGSFGHSAMTNVVFSDITVGTAVNSLGNMVQTNMWDLRGSGVGWSVSGQLNNLYVTNAAGGINWVNNSEIAWDPAAGTIIAVSGVTTSMTKGAAQFFGAAARALVTAPAGFGMGNYRINNVMFNIVYNGRTDQVVAPYVAILILTSA